jgi:hypothetical protein
MGTSYSPDNPFVQKTYSKDNPFVQQPTEQNIEQPGFFSTLGDYARTMFKIAGSHYNWDAITEDSINGPAKQRERQRIIDTGKQLGVKLREVLLWELEILFNIL